MGNPYYDNIDRIASLVKEISRQHLYSSAPEEQYSGQETYGMNFVVVSGGEDFDDDLEEQLEDLMKEVTDDVSNTEDM